MSTAETAAPPGVKTSHPVGFWFIFFGELAERCSFYGMRGLLAMYLVHVFGKTKGEASEVVHLYMAGCYLTGLLGGFVADRLLGKYWTIVLFSVPYVIGQCLIGLSDLTLVYTALVILAFGSGVIKPNISTLMGMTYDQQRPGQELLRSRAFGYFYMAINVGSLLSYQIAPLLRDAFGEIDPATNTLANPKAGYLAGFLFPAVLMAVALVIFAVGKPFYAKEANPVTAEPDPTPAADKWRIVWRLFGLFGLVLFFWMVFDQKATTWIYFANDYLDVRFTTPFPINGKTDWRIPPESLASANPFLILCFVPLLNLLFARLAAKGYRVRPTDKMTAGFLLTAAACGIHAIAGSLATGADGSITKVGVIWQLAAYVSLTLAEVLISVTGLELAYSAAPKSMKSFITALWFVPIFVANLLSSQLAKTYPEVVKLGETPKVPAFELYGVKFFDLYQFPTAQAYFLFLTVLVLAVAAAFVVVARQFNRAMEK
ncbi:MAG: MFS transporter [Fimbriiglobus sp.]|nr:MFS transporter [Fimbriiglobus sp.]